MTVRMGYILNTGEKGLMGSEPPAEVAFQGRMKSLLKGGHTISVPQSCQLLIGRNNLSVSFRHVRLCAHPYGQSSTHLLQTGFADLK